MFLVLREVDGEARDRLLEVDELGGAVGQKGAGGLVDLEAAGGEPGLGGRDVNILYSRLKCTSINTII